MFNNKWLDKKYNFFKKCNGRRFGLRSLAISQKHIAEWFSSLVGQRILEQEQACIDALLPEMFGYHLMQLSVLPNTSLFSTSSTSHQFVVDPNGVYQSSKASSSVTATFEQLPIDADVIDVALLHHALDYSTHPHQLLREVTRTLIPNGHIVLLGFNPFSLLGLGHSLARLFSRSYMYRRQHMPVSRLKDWFEVLDLDLVYSKRGYYSLPFNRYYSTRVNHFLKMLCPLWGGFYVLVLRKNITPMTTIKSKWKKRSVLPVWRKGVVTQSSSHSSSNNKVHSQKVELNNDNKNIRKK